MFGTTGLIAFVFITDENNGVVVVGGLAVDKSLSFGGGRTADFTINNFGADGGGTFDFIRQSKEGGHGTKRFTTKILGEAGKNDVDICFEKYLYNIDNGGVKKLNFFNGHDLSVRFKAFKNIDGIFDGTGVVFASGMGTDFGDDAPAIVDSRFEDLNFFAADLSAGNFFEKQFRFAGIHGTGDTFHTFSHR